jgi:hypothetical protein
MIKQVRLIEMDNSLPKISCKLKLFQAGDSGYCCEDQLIRVKRELTLKDYEEYESIGWKHYREEHFIDTLLPSLGDPLFFSHKHSIFDGVVVQVKGTKYLVQFEDKNDEPYNVDGKFLILTPTVKPLSVPDRDKSDDWSKRHRGHYLQFFGQPSWVQGPVYPTDVRGNACYHFLTIENGWGDCGNFNILLGLNGDIPSEAYFEAACC